MYKVGVPFKTPRRGYALWAFTFAGHSRTPRLVYKTLSLLGLPIGILTTYFAFQNEHRHEEEMKGKEPFVRIYPREIKKLHWGDGQTAFTDCMSEKFNYTQHHKVKFPTPAD
ncbi:unnamed protein product [Schistosoma turkestanicum]|nr:unnamed protein product [Schistosoma turkestanicum]